MSFLTVFIDTNGTTFYTQHTKIDPPEVFGHAVNEYQSGSKLKQTVAASVHLQYYMDAISHQPIKREDMEHFHMTHDFWGDSTTYLGHNARNKTMMKFPRSKDTASRKAVMSRKVASTVTSKKDVTKICSSNESDILLNILDQHKKLKMESKS